MNTWEAREHNVGQINISTSIEKASEHNTHFQRPKQGYSDELNYRPRQSSTTEIKRSDR